MRTFDALVRALRSSADTFYYVPGYPIDDVAEALNAEVCVNEMVALGHALGDSISGRRSAVLVKNLGMNALADTLVNATVQGLMSGVVIVVGDDVTAKKSQVAQDSRYYGEVAMVPVLEVHPQDVDLAVEQAFEASESFSRVAILRFTPDALDVDSTSSPSRREDGQGSIVPADLTMRGRWQRACNSTADMFEWATTRPYVSYPPSASDRRDVGRPFRSEHRWSPPPRCPEPQTIAMVGNFGNICDGCPYSVLFEEMSAAGTKAVLDTGCCIFSRYPPYEVGLVSYGLGSSLPIAARSTGVVLTGDYALLHSGINALIDLDMKGLPLLVVVMRNRIMGMTGGQSVPDIIKYIPWTEPIVLRADDRAGIRNAIQGANGLKVVIVDGECPDGGVNA